METKQKIVIETDGLAKNTDVYYKGKKMPLVYEIAIMPFKAGEEGIFAEVKRYVSDLEKEDMPLVVKDMLTNGNIAVYNSEIYQVEKIIWKD